MNKKYSNSLLSLLSSKFSGKFHLLLMVLFVNLTPLFSFGQTQTFNSTGSFVVPAGVTSITVQVWGAGGGGDNSTNYGGGGAFAQSTFPVTSGNIYAITVGLGAGSGTGGDGGDSSFGSVVVAKGGKGGSIGNGGLASQSTGDIKFNGGNGGKSSGNAGAGGGAAAGTGNDGNPGGSATSNTIGNGGVGINGGGSGGNGGVDYSSGIPGVAPGGGGGERGKNSIFGSSGAGGNGRVIINYCLSNSAGTASTTPTVCLNTPLTAITHTTTGATGISNSGVSGANGLPLGVLATWVSNKITISGTPLASGTFNYSIPLTGGCGIVSAVGSLTVSTASVVPTAISGTTAICLGSSTSLNVSGGTFGSGATAKWYSGSCGGTLVGSGNMISVSPTITTTYYVRYEGSCNSTSCISTTVIVNAPLSNNSLFFNSGTSGQVNKTADENANALLTAPPGSYFSNVAFASYGTPIGTAPNFTIGTCHATSSQSKMEGYLLGNNAATIPATNAVFGDPCVGTLKKLSVLASFIEPICSGSVITITGSTPIGGTGTYTYLWESSTTSASSGFAAATGTNNAINYTSGLIAQTTWFRRTVTSCALSSISSVMMIKVNGINTWNGSIWSSGSVPTSSQAIEFNGDYNLNTDITGCSCEVKSGNVTIKDGKTMTLTNELKVSGGTLTFENNASLVQINDNAANSGEITYKRKIPTIRKTDYVYWSSPVSNFTLGGIQTGTLYYSFDGVANDYVKAYPTTVMDKGKGYIVRGAGTGFDDGTIDITTSFKGIPNNGGNFIVPVTGAGTTNLIGNPYPSALSADAFLAANNKILEGTLYFWTHNTSIRLKGELNPGTAGSGAYAYTSDDYAAYNFTGGIATTGKGEESISKASTIPNGFIASGVAFFAEGIASGGNLIFKNEMRLSSVVTGSTILDNSQVFRTAVSGTKKAKIAPANSIEKNRVWLNLTNAQGAFKQILVGYVTGATNDYDNGYDGESFDGNDFIDFYSINHNKNLTIQGRALPFDATDSVPLGYSSTIKGGFSISIEEVDGTMQSQSVFLEDRVLNVVQDLKVSPYTFNTAAGTFHDRFVLRYTDRTLGNVDFDKTNNQVSISKDKNDLKVKSEIETIKQITVFDLLGKKVFEKEAVNSYEFSSSAFGLSKQVGIVKVTLANGQVISKKVVF